MVRINLLKFTCELLFKNTVTRKYSDLDEWVISPHIVYVVVVFYSLVMERNLGKINCMYITYNKNNIAFMYNILSIICQGIEKSTVYSDYFTA